MIFHKALTKNIAFLSVTNVRLLLISPSLFREGRARGRKQGLSDSSRIS